jgi:hypothetical protein
MYMQEKPGRQGAADGLAATQKLKDSKVYTEVKEFSLEINLFFFSCWGSNQGLTPSRQGLYY